MCPSKEHGSAVSAAAAYGPSETLYLSNQDTHKPPVLVWIMRWRLFINSKENVSNLEIWIIKHKTHTGTSLYTEGSYRRHKRKLQTQPSSLLRMSSLRWQSHSRHPPYDWAKVTPQLASPCQATNAKTDPQRWWIPPKSTMRMGSQHSNVTNSNKSPIPLHTRRNTWTPPRRVLA